MEVVVNSCSGGKTSSYTLANYEADYNLFSLVCVDDPKCGHPDKFFMKYANDKLSKYCSEYGEVLGTCEDPMIFKTMYELEQFTGKEIIWLRGESFDKLINRKQGLPAKEKFTLGRYCTTWLKIAPAFEFWFKYIAPIKIGVNLGYRYDEQERKEYFTTTWDYPYCCNNYGLKKQKWIHKLEWRYGKFPLIDDGIFHKHIKDFWIGKNVHFASDSNCQICIYKSIHQIAMNAKNCPSQIDWGNKMESFTGKKWHKDFSIKQAQLTTIQSDFIYGTGAGCLAGECIS